MVNWWEEHGGAPSAVHILDYTRHVSLAVSREWFQKNAVELGCGFFVEGALAG
jgi:hypothetical protein